MDYTFLSKIPTKFHKLNLNLCKDSDSKPESLLERDNIKMLTYNIFQVPWIASFAHPSPHGPGRLKELTKFFD